MSSAEALIVSYSNFRRRLAVVTVVALLLRLIYVFAFSQRFRTPAHGDYYFFHWMANLLARGKGYVQPTNFMHNGVLQSTAEHPPLWPFLLSLVSRVGGTSELAHRLVGVPIGTITVAVMGLLGRRVSGDWAGLTAAGLASLYPIMIGADGSLMSETLYGLLIAIILLTAYFVIDRPTIWRSALLGAEIGLAALTRTEALVLILLLAVPLVVRIRARRWRLFLACCAAAAIVITPWTARNWTRFHQFVLVSTNDGTLLRGANCDQTYFGREIGFWHVYCLTPPFVDNNEAHLSARWRREGIMYAEQHLGRLPVVLVARELRTWSLWMQGDELFQAEGRNLYVEAAGIFVYYGVVGFAALGLLELRRRREPLLVLLTPVVMVVLQTAGAYGYTKFRYPAEISLVVLAGVALSRLGPILTATRRARATRAPFVSKR
jgi:4-amino-4-deoxy-L-arabinose transferase-like glycosyltransferase